MSGQRLSMIGKWGTAHKVSINEAKQEFLIQAGISRYDEPESIADLMAFPASPAARRMTGAQFASMAVRWSL